MNNFWHVKWMASGAAVGFGSSFIFADLLNLPLDLYYLLYFVTIITFFSPISGKPIWTSAPGLPKDGLGPSCLD
jgi:hypothetical protein